ncbi:ash family protein [Shigella dysenteriae]|nr:ash family protein [Shigella dysenteriae]EFZ2377478.1 ash family protein [Shigella dysenteriae]HCR5705684.1 ash family protein [Shigella dysenteriae]HCS1834432.1 ash family protein [Shigella dysenteriae]
MCHSNQALAKSSAGIGVPDLLKGAYAARAVFLCVMHNPSILWWAVWGHRKVRRVLLAGYANPAQFTTNRLASVVVITRLKGDHYDNSKKTIPRRSI